MVQLTLVIHPDGRVRSVYSDVLHEMGLGPLSVVRASVIEFDEPTQEWVARRVNVVGGELQLGDVIARGPNRGSVEVREREVLEAEI